MQRSFNGGYNSGGGGGMIRTVHRVIRSGVGGAPTEPVTTTNITTATSSTIDSRKSKNFNTSSSPNTPFTLSASSSTTNVRDRLPSVINDVSAHLHADDINTEWECVEGISYYGNNNNNNYNDEDAVYDQDYHHHVFGTVPSRDEVVHAVSALQQFLEASSPYTRSPTRKPDQETDKDVKEDEVPCWMERTSSNEYNEIEDWIEPSLNLCGSRTSLQTRGTERVYDAFHLLQNEPSIQRMVVSLSSDKAVWDAVLDNEVVKELRSSIAEADKTKEETSNKGSGDDSNPIKDIIGWLILNAKATLTQLIDKITKLVNEIFQAPNEGKNRENVHPFEENLKTSLMLSVVVLLIVVITRATKSA